MGDTWHTSSYSHTVDCVECSWHKASQSGPNGNCVEAAGCTYGVKVRDTKDRDGGTLEFTRQAWADFLDAIKTGELAG